MKKTVVLGASPNPARYSFKAVKSLVRHGHEVVAVGFRPGVIPVAMKPAGVIEKFILRGIPEIEGVHTVSLYIGPERQQEYFEYIISLKPERVIFNPGTFNEEFMERLEGLGIETIEGCQLVMLSSDQY
jgi:uncharacterized protein